MSWPALVSFVVLASLYASALFAPALAPYHYAEQHRGFPHCPPSPVRLNPPTAWLSDGVLYTPAYELETVAGRRYTDAVFAAADSEKD